MEKEKVTAIVDKYEHVDDDIVKVKKPGAMGTVTISDTEDVIMVPTPSADPQDPLNMPKWRKMLFIVLLSIFSSIGLALVSGFGGLLGFYIPQYEAEGIGYNGISRLMTFPTMFMGVGNLICIPLAMAIGRRPVYLGSLVLLVAGGVLAAYAKDYNWHLGARMLLGFSAGNSEALEIHFLHERSTCITYQVTIQTVVNCVYCLFASPIAGAIGPRNWYNLGAGLSAATLLFSIFLAPETKYVRSLAAYGQTTETVSDNLDDCHDNSPPQIRISERPAFDYENFAARTWRSDLRLFSVVPDWSEGLYALRNTFQVLLFPNVLWAFCLNGLTIGVNIAIGTTYGEIMQTGYGWGHSSVSYVTAGQIVTALIALPVLGKGSDWAIKRAAKRNGGVHEPENRLLLLWLPIIVGVISATIYGQAAQHPDQYHWFAIAFAYAAYYFCFLGANIGGITYLLDSYPARSAPVLVVICAFRGFVSFGTSYGVTNFIETSGYDGSFGTYAGLTALFGLLGLPVFFYGKRIRQFTGKWAVKSTNGRPSQSY
ncbi:MFS general substrate transporter [Hortaea werneckii]|nr:MFS general substrate transporter [Hortaea werneckii]